MAVTRRTLDAQVVSLVNSWWIWVGNLSRVPKSQSLFAGSGVMEAGCKTIVGQRLKPSGMRWTVSGAKKIIARRCCQLSGRWEGFREKRSTG